GRVSDAQASSLTELRAGADRLETFFDRLRAFSKESPPAVRALGRAAKTGTGTAKVAAPALDELNRTAERTPELAKNAAITFEHLNDREWAVEPDPRSPGGKGYTGIEAILQFAFNQAIAINIFNENNHILKV